MSEMIRFPLFVDMHVHFREPGSNRAETIESGTVAALHGGYGAVFDMPNNPSAQTWTLERVLEKHELARASARTMIGFYAGWQPGEGIDPREPARMAPFVAGMKRYMTETYGNDRVCTPRDFRESDVAFHEAAPDKPLLVHPHNIDQVEEYIKDFALPFGHHLHVCHVNDPAIGLLVDKFQKDGAPVSSGVTGHHLTKAGHDRHTHGKFAEMMPELTDPEALLWQLDQGIIDVVETDHAPHSYESKMDAEINGNACFGVPGIELTFPILQYQVRNGRLGQERLIDAMSTRPAKIMGVKLRQNDYSEWVLNTFRIEREDDLAVSGSGWTPYLGQMATGSLFSLKIQGREIFEHNEPEFEPLTEHGMDPVITDRLVA